MGLVAFRVDHTRLQGRREGREGREGGREGRRERGREMWDINVQKVPLFNPQHFRTGNTLAKS